ncbi:MAG: SDR family NAD(P)-dependent oxidoreductase [Chloroflexota bacterium]
MIKTVLITGANAGLGKESARQLALQDGIEKIILACRNEDKAKTAKRELEAATGKSIFEILIVDVSELDSVRTAVKSLNKPVDALVMNAGGTGGKYFHEKTKYGVTRQFAVNVLGHVVMAEEMLKAKKVTQAVLYAGSEAARGVPKMGVKRPNLQTSSVEEFVSIIDGSFFTKTNDPLVPYGPVKYVAALWMSWLARKYPTVRIVTVSPGSTSGTNGGEDLAPLMKFVFTKIGPVLLPLFGLMHSVEQGAKRYVDVLQDDSYKSGVFYASKAPTLTGPLVDQSTIFADLGNIVFQENASKAIHSFIR